MSRSPRGAQPDRSQRLDRAAEVGGQHHHVVDLHGAVRVHAGAAGSASDAVVGRPSSVPAASRAGVASRSDHPRMRLPPSRPTRRTRTEPIRQVPSASTANPAASHASGGSPTRISSIVTPMARTLRSPAMVDVVVVGSGPNGLAAALTCAQAGRSVLVLEAADTIGGGTRTEELTLPGFAHDVCSAIHPLAAVSPFFAAAGLDRYGLELLQPERALVHPLDGGRAGVLHRSLAETIAGLGADGRAWDRHLGWITRHWSTLGSDTLAPLLRVPRHPFTMAAFGARGALPATWFGRAFATDEARGLFAGCAAHSFLPLDRPFTTSMGLMLLASAHVAGWPSAKGGSQSIADAMAAKLRDLGGTIETGHPVRSLADVPESTVVLFDVTPRQLLEICGDELPAGYRRAPGSLPLRPRRVQGGLRPVRARPVDERRRPPGRLPAPRGHARGDRGGGGGGGRGAPPGPPVRAGGPAEPLRPDPRPCRPAHAVDLLPRPPRLRRRTSARRSRPRSSGSPPASGTSSWPATWARAAGTSATTPTASAATSPVARMRAPSSLLRPRPGVHPYRTPNPRFFLCSASTPPGGGVHGMCGMHAAEAALPTTLPRSAVLGVAAAVGLAAVVGLLLASPQGGLLGALRHKGTEVIGAGATAPSR